MNTAIKKRGQTEAWPIPGIGRFFDDFFLRGEAQATRALRPAMDVDEDDNAITVKTELPGIAKDDVHVMLEDGVLTITGEKKSDREAKDKNFHLVERSFGAFHRSITLPTGVETDSVDASFEHGVLVIRIPKTETAKPRRIAIT